MDYRPARPERTGRGASVDITALPFNRLLGLEWADPTTGCLVSLPDGPRYTNHLGTVHAAALLAVAEAGSGAFLVRHLGDWAGHLPVVRRLESKFRRPARGRVSARASTQASELDRVRAELAARGRTRVTVAVEVVDEGGTVVMAAGVEWFIARGDEAPGQS
jgi:acyl-coenzyme A thioesterase PaaI-like protein